MTHYRISRKPAVNPEGSWVNASYELTWAVEELTNRPDLLVKIAPDAAYDDSAYDHDGNLIRDPQTGEPVAHQHAAITFLETAVVEINPDLLPKEIRDDPSTFHPLSRQDRKRYPVVWGAAIHEIAHADHSDWVLETNKRFSELTPEERQWAGAAMLLEESRIEKNQVESRPQDQPWLEAAGMHVAVEEYAEASRAIDQFRKENPGFNELKLSRYKCGRAAALALARVDSGSVFRSPKIDEIETLVREAFGDKDYDELREIWITAQNTRDDDAETMIELGHRWFDLTQDSGDDRTPMGIAIEMEGDASSWSDGLGEALSEGASQSVKEASGEADEERRQARINAKRNAAKSEATHHSQAQAQADKVFGSGAGAPVKNMGHPVTGYRGASKAEVNLARVTRRRLQNAYVPEKTATRVSRDLPPGRLSVRSLQQRTAQRNAGMIPSAEPFTYTERKHVTTPPLRVGIVQDVSGSQAGPAAAAVSGAWSLAKAANEIPDAKVAMVSFGNDVHSIIKPLTRMDRGVPVLHTNAGTHYFLDALRAIEGELDFTRSGAARLLVIITDGDLAFSDLQGRDAALKRLTGFGVKVLWVDADGGEYYLPKKMPGLHITRTSGNYSAIPSVICHEAITALTK